MTPYNYCAGNPVKLVDPSGMEGMSCDEIVDLGNKCNTYGGPVVASKKIAVNEEAQSRYKETCSKSYNKPVG